MTSRRGRTAPSSGAAAGVRPRPSAVRATRQRATDTDSAPKSLVNDLFFRRMVQSMRNGVVAITREGGVVIINDVAYRILGVTPSTDDVGKPFGEVLQAQPDIVRILASAFELSHLPNRAELRLKPTDKVIGYTLALVQDENGSPVGAALHFKDLTRVEQLEERERLRDRLAALGEMAAALAHELKNPLAGIEVMAGLLRRRLQDPPEVQSLLNDIISETKMANAIVVEVLEFVRPIRLQVEHTSIAQVLHDAVRLAESKAPRGDIAVTLSIPAHLPLIQGDHHQLCQVFTNLLVNAFEALEGKGNVSITASPSVIEEEQHPAESRVSIPTVVVDVVDDGPGVGPEVAERIFNPFFTTKPQGSGLGLAIVRKIVDAHDGRIDMSSPAGGGTRFRVTLPMSASDKWFE